MLTSTGATVQVWDDGEAGRKGLADALSTLAPDVAARITCKPFESLNGFEALILSPGIPHVLPKPHPIALKAKAAGIPILSDAELLYRAVRQSGSKARFVGITGTNGKSTTTTLLAHILAEAKLPVAAGATLGLRLWPCLFCQITAYMCWKCHPTCWNGWIPCTLMPHVC